MTYLKFTYNIGKDCCGAVVMHRSLLDQKAFTIWYSPIYFLFEFFSGGWESNSRHFSTLFRPQTSKEYRLLKSPCLLHQYCQWQQQQKKKSKEEAYPWKAGACSGHITNLQQSILQTFDIYCLGSCTLPLSYTSSPDACTLTYVVTWSVFPLSITSTVVSYLWEMPRAYHQSGSCNLYSSSRDSCLLRHCNNYDRKKYRLQERML